MQNRIINILNGQDKNVYHFHFVGVGGVSMYSLAIYLKNLGQEVSGSDARISKNTKALQKRSIKVSCGHKQENVYGANFVIYSFAVEDNVEVKAAKRLNIPCFSRAEILGLMLNQYKNRICIAGAHGKTTTTALIYEILKCANKNPSLHLGGRLVSIEDSYEYASKEYIVCEACEYKDAFLNFSPTIGVILNIASEHLDYFKTFDNVKKSFKAFSLSANLLICEKQNTFSHKKRIVLGEGGFIAQNIKKHKGIQSFDVYNKGKLYGRFNLNLIGIHNIKNALFSIAVAYALKIEKSAIEKALKQFKGVKRRFEVVSKNPIIISDYAHHPDEVRAAISTVKEFYGKNLFVIFQPHTYTRTKNLKNEFKKAFAGCNLAIYRTFSAREKYIKNGSAKSLSKAVVGSIYINNKQQLKNIIRERIKQGYNILVLGAGNLGENVNKLL